MEVDRTLLRQRKNFSWDYLWVDSTEEIIKWLSFEDFRGGYACKPVGITTDEKLKQDIEYMKGLEK